MYSEKLLHSGLYHVRESAKVLLNVAHCFNENQVQQISRPSKLEAQREARVKFLLLCKIHFSILALSHDDWCDCFYSIYSDTRIMYGK